MKGLKRKWERGLKRVAAVAMALILAGTTVDMSTFAVSAEMDTQIGSCEHQHDETCGYVTVSGNEACSHEHDESCSYATVSGNDATMKIISDWNWIETEGFEDMIDSENILPLVGVNERNPVDMETLLAVLPAQITAAIGEEQEEVALSGWSCADFPAEGAGSGSYVFTASLPEGYELGRTPLNSP